MKGAIWSLLGLTLLQAALSGRTNTGRIGELATSVSDVLSWVIDPDKPAIPDLRTSTSPGSPGSPGSSGGSGAGDAQKGTGRGRLPSTATAPAPLPTVSPNSSSNYLTA